MPNQPILAAASSDTTISIWNMQARRQMVSLESHVSAVEGISFSARGVLLASTAEGDDMVGGTVRLWRTDTWEELFILKELGSAEDTLAFHPTLPILATRCHGNSAERPGDGTASCIRIWDLDFEAFLANPPFMDGFNRIEAELGQQERNEL
jgi:WD40 repeat protein